MLQPHLTLNCRGILLDLKVPKIMGILNVTPDSFYDGGRYNNVHDGLKQVEKILLEGADIIDIGGMSSRPGAEIITEKEELSRVIPIIESTVKEFPNSIISIDTFRSAVAKAAYEVGASIVNDISGGNLDKDMFQTVAGLDVPYILMHMKGQPKTMQINPEYHDVTLEILDFFIEKIGQLRALNVKDIILDPGFGFGKSLDDNYNILKKLEAFSITDFPILVGVSRKSMIYKLLDIDPESALSATSALHLFSLEKGAKILRVHDVKEAVQVRALWQKLYSEA